jgi:hypothetical protein
MLVINGVLLDLLLLFRQHYYRIVPQGRTSTLRHLEIDKILLRIFIFWKLRKNPHMEGGSIDDVNKMPNYQ